MSSHRKFKMADEALIISLFLLVIAVLSVTGDRFNHPKIPPPPPVPPPLFIPVLQPIFQRTPNWQSSGRSKQEYSKTGFPLWPHPPYQSLKFEDVPNEEVFPPALQMQARVKKPRYRTVATDNVRLEWLPNMNNADKVLKMMFESIPLTMLKDVNLYVNGNDSSNRGGNHKKPATNAHTNGVFFQEYQRDFNGMNNLYNPNMYPIIDFNNLNQNQMLNNNNGISNNFNPIKSSDLNQNLINLNKYLMNILNNTGQNAFNNNFNPSIHEDNFNNHNNNDQNMIFNNNNNNNNNINNNGQNMFNNNANGQNMFTNNNWQNNQFASNIQSTFSPENNNPNNINVNQNNNFNNNQNNEFGNDFLMNEQFVNDNSNFNNVNNNENHQNNVHYTNSNFISRRLASVDEENNKDDAHKVSKIQKRDTEKQRKEFQDFEEENNFEEKINKDKQDNGVPGDDDDELESQDLPEEELEAFFNRNGLGGENPPWFYNADPELGLKSVQVVRPIAEQIEPFMRLTTEEHNALMRTLNLPSKEQDSIDKTADDGNTGNNIKGSNLSNLNTIENGLPDENSSQPLIRKGRQLQSNSESFPREHLRLLNNSHSHNLQKRQHYPLSPPAVIRSSPPFLHSVNGDSRHYNFQHTPNTPHTNSQFVHQIPNSKPMLYNTDNHKPRMLPNQGGRTLIQRNVKIPKDLRQLVKSMSSNKHETISLGNPRNFLGKDFTKYWATNKTVDVKQNDNTDADYTESDDAFETDGRYSKFDDEFETSDTDTITDQHYLTTTPDLEENENDLGLPEEDGLVKDKYVIQGSPYTENSPVLDSMDTLSRPNVLAPTMHYESNPYVKSETDYEMGQLIRPQEHYIESPPHHYRRGEHLGKPNPFLIRHPEDHVHMNRVPPPHLMRQKYPVMKEPMPFPHPSQVLISKPKYYIREPHFNPHIHDIHSQHERPPVMLHHIPPEIHDFVESKPEEHHYDPQVDHFIQIEPESNMQYRNPKTIHHYLERDPQVVYEQPTLAEDYIEIEPETKHQNPTLLNDYLEEDLQRPKYAKPILVAEYIEEAESPVKYQKPTYVQKYKEESSPIQHQTHAAIQAYEEMQPEIQYQKPSYTPQYIEDSPQVQHEKPMLIHEYEERDPQQQKEQSPKIQKYVLREPQVKPKAPVQKQTVTITKVQNPVKKYPTEIKFQNTNYKVKYIDHIKQPKFKLNHLISQSQSIPTISFPASKHPNVLNANKKLPTVSKLLPVAPIPFPYVFQKPLIANPTMQTGVRLFHPLQPTAALPIRPAPEAFLHAPLLIRRKESSHAQDSFSKLQRISDENQVENPKVAAASQTASVTTPKPPISTTTRRYGYLKNPTQSKTQLYQNVALKSPVTYQQKNQQTVFPVYPRQYQKPILPQKSGNMPTYYRNFTQRNYLGLNTAQSNYRGPTPVTTTKRPIKNMSYLRVPNIQNQDQTKQREPNKSPSSPPQRIQKVPTETDATNVVGYLHDEEYFGKRIDAKENTTNNKNKNSYSRFTTERSTYDEATWNDESSIQSSVPNRKPKRNRFQDQNSVTITGDMWQRGK